jgi:predicted TIM-barrel fold metal-dependent hydrolase
MRCSVASFAAARYAQFWNQRLKVGKIIRYERNQRLPARTATRAGRARCVVALDMDVGEKKLAALDVRGVLLNTDNKGGMPIGMDEIPELVARIAPFGWHLEFLFPGGDIVVLMPVFTALRVPVSIAHFAYQNGLVPVPKMA